MTQHERPEMVVLRLLMRARKRNEFNADGALDYLLRQVETRLRRSAARATAIELLICLTFSRAYVGSLWDELRLVYDSLYAFARCCRQDQSVIEIQEGRFWRYLRALAQLYANLHIVERQRAFGTVVCWDASQYCEVDGVRELAPTSSLASEAKKDYARWVLRHRITPGHRVHSKGVLARFVLAPQLKEGRHVALLFPSPNGWDFHPVRYGDGVTNNTCVCRIPANAGNGVRLVDVFSFLRKVTKVFDEKTDPKMFRYARRLGIVSMPHRYPHLDFFFRGHPIPDRHAYDLAALTYYLDWWVAESFSGLRVLEERFETLVGRLCDESEFATPASVRHFLRRPLGHPNITDIDAMLMVEGVVYFVNAYATLEDASNCGLQRAGQNRTAVEEKLANWQAKQAPLLAFLNTQPEWHDFRKMAAKFVICTPKPLNSARRHTWDEEWFCGAKQNRSLHLRDLPSIFSLYELIACLENRTMSCQGASQVLADNRFDDLY